MSFRDIRGPAESKPGNFSQLCSRLVQSVFVDAKPIDRNGEDEGIDSFIGHLDGAIRVFQYKHFPDGLGRTQRRQIEASLSQVTRLHEVAEWTLMLPIDLNSSETRWFERLRGNYPQTILKWWGATKLQELLAHHPRVASDFLPQPTVVTVLVTGGLEPHSPSSSQSRELLREAVGVSRSTEEVNELLDELVNEVGRRARLRLLIWGPGPTGGELYDKRRQVRDTLRNIGHQADFSEDVWSQDRLRQSGLNLKVAELLQARAYDYIVCFMASPGSIGEVHDFANQAALASKMMICIDSRHREGYSACGALRIFEGLNGRLHWFDAPNDLTECHLSTRVLEQLEKVAESKQFAVATTWGGA